MLNKITEVANSLKKWGRENGYDPLIIFSQGAVETGDYTCELSKRNNFFGMFATKGYTGNVYECLTHEYEVVNGVPQRVPHITKFKAFDTPEACFVDYDNYVKGKFPEAYKHKTEYRQYYQNLMTYIEDTNGQKKIIYPSFCTAFDYEKVLIRKYEMLAKGSGGYELIFTLENR